MECGRKLHKKPSCGPVEQALLPSPTHSKQRTRLEAQQAGSGRVGAHAACEAAQLLAALGVPAEGRRGGANQVCMQVEGKEWLGRLAPQFELRSADTCYAVDQQLCPEPQPHSVPSSPYPALALTCTWS